MTNYKDASSNLIVNYLPQEMSDKELYYMFVTIGPVESCMVMKDFKTGFSCCYGFVKYSKEEDASKAIAQLNGLEVGNKRIKVAYASRGSSKAKVVVKHLPSNFTDDQLDSLFGSFGTIVASKILKDRVTGQSKGTAFVRYSIESEADEAIKKMDGVIPEGALERLTVKIAVERWKLNAANYAGVRTSRNQNRGDGNKWGNPQGRNIPRIGQRMPVVCDPPSSRNTSPLIGQPLLIRTPPPLTDQPPLTSKPPPLITKPRPLTGQPPFTSQPLLNRPPPPVISPPIIRQPPPSPSSFSQSLVYSMTIYGGFGALTPDEGHHIYNPVGGNNMPGFNPYHVWN